MNKLLSMGIVSTALVVSGCAQKAEDISASYVSPLTYQNFSCRQISEEANRVTAEAAQLSGVQNKKAENDAVATGVALVLFWPAAFFIKGDKTTAAELGRLKGELEALEQASNKRNCGIKFVKIAPPETEEPKDDEEYAPPVSE